MKYQRNICAKAFIQAGATRAKDMDKRQQSLTSQQRQKNGRNYHLSEKNEVTCDRLLASCSSLADRFNRESGPRFFVYAHFRATESGWYPVSTTTGPWRLLDKRVKKSLAALFNSPFNSAQLNKNGRSLCPGSYSRQIFSATLRLLPAKLRAGRFALRSKPYSP